MGHAVLSDRTVNALGFQLESDSRKSTGRFYVPRLHQ